MKEVDVLCIGYACWDLNFQISEHPGPDDKIFARELISEGGGPAANAAYAIAKLGGQVAFAGRLGKDPLGNAHLEELKAAGVDTSCILLSDTTTSTSSVWVNHEGQRSIVNYRPNRSKDQLSFTDLYPGCLLMDGHEYESSLSALERFPSIPSLLDAGSLNDRTSELSTKASHVVASSTFAKSLAQSEDPNDGLRKLAERAAHVAITCGSGGVIWHSQDGSRGSIPALKVEVLDTTAAGDIFHGACALALAKGHSFPGALAWANEVGGTSVTKTGGRQSAPDAMEVSTLKSIS